jgi:hypothetical protein
MSKAHRGPIGPFILKSSRGETRAFDTLMDAAMAIRYSGLQMVERPLESGFWLNSTYVPADVGLFVLVDECGLIVPLWRIQEAMNKLPPRKRIGRNSNYDPAKHFRNGPLEAGGSRRYGRYYRNVRTRSELRAHAGMEADMQDLEEYPCQVKIRARRKAVPTCRDDVMRSRKGSCWKNFRPHQYKDRDPQ